MVRYQRGERAAFAELVRRQSRPIYNFVLRQSRQITASVASCVFLAVMAESVADLLTRKVGTLFERGAL